ncbi:hypothetical protein JCM10213_003998 [Rhodosporidiobolus nylandii]
MSRPARVDPTADEMDLLESMLDRMGQHHRQPSPSPSPRPASQAFPTRTSSRASSNSRLSERSSSRSLHSLHSLHAMPSSGGGRVGRSSSDLSRGREVAPSADEGDEDEEEGETTPSLQQGEWGGSSARAPHGRSHTVGSVPHRVSDDAGSVRSYASREGDSFYYPPPRSVPTSPQTRPRQATPSSAPFDRTSSPLRLLPRSPLNERTPLEDLTFFREAEEDRWELGGGGGGDSESIHSARSDHSAMSAALSVSSTPSVSGPPNGRPVSLRTARLREDIEREARRIKERSSGEELRRAALSQTQESASRPASAPERGSVGSASSVPLYPGAPVPSSSSPTPPPLSHMASTSSLRGNGDDTRSVRSVGSTSAASVAGTWAPPTATAGSSSAASVISASGSAGGSGSGHTSASARTEYGEGRERMRQRESREWSQTCWVWQTRQASSSGSSGGKFSKAPLIRDVPSVMKRKSAKRESAHHLLSPAEAILFNVEGGDSKSSSGSSSKDKDKGREKGKEKGGGAASPVGRDGGWRRATGVLRDDGYFRVFSESDKTVIHSVHLPSLSRTDVRLVDHSLFGRPNCISISRRPASPSTPHRASFLPSSSTSSSTSFSASPLPGHPHKADEPLYLCFPSVVATQVWLVMAHCFARPEYYLASGAATLRPLRTARGGAPPGYPSDSGTESESDAPRSSSPSDAADDGLGSSCRIYRSLQLSINEGRALGELATEVIRPGPKTSWEQRPGTGERGDSEGASTSFSGSDSLETATTSSPAGKLQMPRLQARASGMDGRGERDGDSSAEAFCEIEMAGEIVARTSVRKGTSPFWNEAFVFSDLPPFVAPITIRVLQSSKSSSRPHLVGTATVRVPDLPRHELVEDWWAIKPAQPAKASDVVGELSLSMRVGEEVVLPSREYQSMLKLLSDDSDAELATDIAHEFPADLEEVTKILLRIYQADAQLVPRLLRLADLEIDSNSRNNRSAAILFRGNTILTKSVELYLRLIGAEYLDASIGEPIRRICAEKVEIEIDPMKFKGGSYKEKELQANIHALHEWTMTVWNSIYDAREKCPHDLRQIFGHIQRIVVDKYGQHEDQKNTRWTCVSAFIFLRFFVPAVLNPKLFFIVSTPPDPKSQRTLTLVAKTLQGLANFSSFGQKEPFMLPMNSFVQDNTAAFVDFIEHISNAAPSTGYRQEWTSPSAAAYLAPYRLRNGLPALEKEGVPLLPHLIDLPRELGLLASHVARFVAEKGPLTEEGAYAGGEYPTRSETPSVASSRGGRSHRFLQLAETCVDVHTESRRRGGGLVSSATYIDLRNRTPDPKSRTKRALAGRPATTNSFIGSGAGLRKSLGVPSTYGRDSPDELHIRNPAPPVPPADSDLLHHRQDSSEASGRSSVASRRSHRSFTINGPGGPGSSSGVGLARSGSFPPKSFSTEDLSLLAAIQTPDPRREREFSRDVAGSPAPGSVGMTTSATITSFASHLEDQENSFMIDEEEFSPLNPGPQLPLFGVPPPTPSSRIRHPQTVNEASEPYSFPPVRSRSNTTTASPARPHAPTASSAAKHASAVPSTSSASSRSTSTTRSGQVVSPTPGLSVAPTSRIRITQETTTTSSYDPSVTGPLSPGAPGLEEDTLSPTSTEEGTPFESSFGGFVAPLMRQQTSQTSARSMTSSLSSMSISAEVHAGPASSSPSTSSSGGTMAGRRTSSAGLSLGFSLGGGRKHSASGSGSGGSRGGVDEDGSEASGSSRNGGGKGGLLSRAMGRKGSRAS